MTSRDRPALQPSEISRAMIRALWRNFPSPIEIDVRDDAAAVKVISAILKAQAR
jgi:hypothetical protein